MKAQENVDAYLSEFASDIQKRLKAIRSLIKKVAPDAEESISYGMPAYKLNKKPLIYFAGYKNHTGLYATPSGHASFKKDLAKYKGGKGSVQFPHDEPLPMKLIERMIKFRVEEARLIPAKKTKPKA